MSTFSKRSLAERRTCSTQTKTYHYNVTQKGPCSRHKKAKKRNKTRTKSDKFQLLQRVWHVLHEQRIDYEAFCILMCIHRPAVSVSAGVCDTQAQTCTNTHTRNTTIRRCIHCSMWKWHVVQYDLWCPRKKNNFMLWIICVLFLSPSLPLSRSPSLSLSPALSLSSSLHTQFINEMKMGTSW